MKRFLKRLITSTSRRLPQGVQESMLDGVIPGRYEQFQRLGHAFGIESISVKGKNGLAWGALNDRWLLGNYAIRREWSSDTILEFQKLFHASGGTYIDVGANIGLTLIPIAKDKRVDCLGFEPEPHNYAYLEMTLQTNGIGNNVSTSMLALFDQKGSIDFELSPSNTGDHRVRTSDADGLMHEASRDVITVPTERMDDLLNGDLRSPIGIKIDTQGAELRIFAGGERTISRADILSLEFTPHSMRRIGGDIENEFRILHDNFREAKISVGDTDSQATPWTTMNEAIAKLREHWNNPEIGTRYFDVIARK